MRFEFDQEKSATNKKHGINFEEAQTLWLGDLREVDAVLFGKESRTIVTDPINGKFWTAVVTHREDAIRIISCRRANTPELKYHGENEET